MSGRTCQYCGATVSLEARYCDRCGTPLQDGVSRPLRRPRLPHAGRVAWWVLFIAMVAVFTVGGVGGYRYVAGHWRVWEPPLIVTTILPEAEEPPPLTGSNHTITKPGEPDSGVAAYLRSVVAISARGPAGNKSGSGFLFGPGLVLTNAHVVELTECVSVTDDDGALHRGQVVGYDRGLDLALLQVPTMQGWPAQLPLGSAAMIQRGDEVLALGSPKGGRPAPMRLSIVDLEESFMLEGRYYTGMMRLGGGVVQEGNSGGPVVDVATGQAVAVVTASDRQTYAWARPLDSAARELVQTWASQEPAWVCNQGPVASTVELSLMTILPMSGADWMVGTDLVDGAELALRDLEADLRRVGYTVRIDRRDDQGDPRLAAELAREAAANEQVIGVMGSLDSRATRALAGALQPSGKPVVAPLANADDLTRNGWRHFYRITANASSQEFAAVRFAQKLDLKEFLVVHDGSPDAQAQAKLFETNADMLLVSTVGQAVYTNYPDLKQQLASTNAQAIYVAGSSQLAADIANLLWLEGTPYPILGLSGLYDPAKFGAFAHHSVFFTYLTAGPSDQFVRRFESVMGRAPRGYAAYGYDAAWVVLDALRRYGEQHPGQVPTPAELAEEVRNTNHAGWSSSIRFDQRGENSTALIYLYEWRQGRPELWDLLSNN